VRSRIRRAFHGLRTEGAGAAREAAAIGLGIFIGCLPIFGFHLMLCWAAGWLFKLNRLKLYLAANVSNPIVAPTLVFAEIQIGAWLRRGSPHALSIDAVRATNLTVFGVDALVGSLLIGGVLGVAMAAATYTMSRGSADDEAFAALVRETSDRYITTSVTAWEFARGKLRGDPVYRSIVCDRLLTSGGTIIDLGCGQGLALALMTCAEKSFQTGRWPRRWDAPPRFDRRVGVEVRSRTAALAREALKADAEIITADLRQLQQIDCRAALCLDVLHMMPFDEQEAVLARIAAALEPDGVLLVREADASAGWSFTAVRAGNWLKAIAFGAWRQRFYFRTAEEWFACFARHGLVGEVRPMSTRTFSNVLFRMKKSTESIRAQNGLNTTSARAV
jgi:uncharacterized protein (DUF2062 family)